MKKYTVEKSHHSMPVTRNRTEDVEIVTLSIWENGRVVDAIYWLSDNWPGLALAIKHYENQRGD